MRLGELSTDIILDLAGNQASNGQVLAYNGSKIMWIDGLTGLKGNQGNQGNLGYQGNVGQSNQGNQGYQGVIGSGNQGYQGYQGLQGNQGDDVYGDRGNQGNQGSNVANGNQGFQGNQGYQGFQSNHQGNQGNQGNIGNQGNVSYILLPSTPSTNGGVKIGSGINVIGDGTISASGNTGVGTVAGCATFSIAKTTYLISTGGGYASSGPYFSSVVIPQATFTANRMEVICTNADLTIPRDHTIYCRMGIYSIGSNDSLIAQTSRITISTAGLITGNLTSPITLNAGTRYVFALQVEGDACSFIACDAGSFALNPPNHTGRYDINPNYALDSGMISTASTSQGNKRIWVGAYA